MHSSTTSPRPSDYRVELIARAFHAVGGALACRASVDLPGLMTVYDARAVIVVDGTILSGALGSFTTPAWTIGNSSFDKIALNVRHPGNQHPDPRGYAENVLAVFMHELVHLYAHAFQLADVTGPGLRFHTEEFARLAERIGLQVERAPGSSVGVRTTHLTRTARTRYRDFLDLIQQLNLAGIRGIGLAGPPGFTGMLPSAQPGMFVPTTPTSFLSHTPNQ